jgi:hypothetical protein
MTSPSLWQKLFKALASREMFAAMEAESRAWMVQCEGCGYERSIWEMGGIRWKAKGTRRLFSNCANCGRKRWHTIHKKSA